MVFIIIIIISMEILRNSLYIEKLLGHGAFGRVYAASPRQNPDRTKFALKCIFPILKPHKLANELRLLRDLGGQSNVVRLLRAHHDQGSLFMVMEMIEHDRFADIVTKLDLSEISLYMEQLLMALKHVHSHGVMHRDIKPGNFLFDRKGKKFLLVDFGLAQVSTPVPIPVPTTPTTQIKFQHSLNPLKHFINISESSTPLKKWANQDRQPVRLVAGAYESPITNNFQTPQKPGARHSNVPKSGTPGFKAPEILLRYRHQTTAVDLWSAGVIFAMLLSGHTPFFRDCDDARSLLEVIKVLGSQKVVQAARAMGLRFDYPRKESIDLRYLCEHIRKSNPNKRQMELPDSAFDLLNKMLDPNPMTRITAEAALQHAFITTKQNHS